MDEIKNLTKGQQEGLALAMMGRSLFITGKAGTGKSTLVRAIQDNLKKAGKRFISVAPTGIAASNIQGATIHSTFAITPYGVADADTCKFLKEQKRRVLEMADTIIVDEVSMLVAFILDAMHWTLRKNRIKGLDQKQVIFVGDMKQLKPIVNDNTRAVMFEKGYKGIDYTHAFIYSKLDIHTIELDEVMRQDDPEFLHHLNIIREGEKSTEYFKQFITKEASGIILAPYNTTVKDYNESGLAKQAGHLHSFKASIFGNARADEFGLEEEIRVKDGCKIMYLVNSTDAVLRNGTLGTFVARDKGVDAHNWNYFIKVDGVEYELRMVEIEKKEYVYNEKSDKLELESIGTITQYPFKLAYALSIHKSQGLTFDEITVDLTRRCFEDGQMYVAFSRVRTPKGLKIIV